MRKKKVILLISGVFVAVVIGILISFIRTYDSLNIDFKDDVIEYGETFNSEYIVKEHNGELTVEDEPDTDKVGEYETRFVLSEKLFGIKIRRIFIETIRVKDSKAPLIEFNEDEVSIYRGHEYDLRDNINRIYDVIDGDIDTYEIESDVNFEQAGEYTVTVTAEDVNGLQTQGSYVLKVKNPVLSAGEGYDAIYGQLTSVYGYNRAAACGILANIRYESNFNPTAGDYYYGLCQWGGSRKDNLFAYCADNGLDPNTIEGQLAYMNYELCGSYASARQQLLEVPDSSDGAYQAAEIFCNGFEGAASDAGRGELARDYYG